MKYNKNRSLCCCLGRRQKVFLKLQVHWQHWSFSYYKASSNEKTGKLKLNLNPMKKRPPHPQRPPHLRPPVSVCTPRYPKSYPKLPQKTKGTRVSVSGYRYPGYIGSLLPISGLTIGSRNRWYVPGAEFRWKASLNQNYMYPGHLFFIMENWLRIDYGVYKDLCRISLPNRISYLFCDYKLNANWYKV